MQTLFRYYTFSLIFTVICLALAGWYGFVSSGTLIGMAQVLWIVVILSVLEVSLSFDNAVVNASVLKEMDEVWQKRFLTWGIAFAVFGMRIVFPLAIVAVAAGLGPIEAVNLSLNDPRQYEAIVSSAHVGIAAVHERFGVFHFLLQAAQRQHFDHLAGGQSVAIVTELKLQVQFAGCCFAGSRHVQTLKRLTPTRRLLATWFSSSMDTV